MKRKPEPGRASIKWRVFACFAVFTAVMLVLLWVFQVVLLDSFYRMIKKNELQSAMQRVEQNINSDSLGNTLNDIVEQNQINVLLCNRFGQILVDGQGEELYYYAQPNNIGGALYAMGMLDRVFSMTQQQGGSYWEFPQDEVRRKDESASKENFQIVIYTKISQQKNGKQVLVVMSSNLTPLDATVNTLRFQLLVVTGVLLLLALLLALFLSRKISRPIVSINTSAKELAKGDYTVDFPENGYREIAELGRTLNYAASELSKVETLQRDLIANISHDLRTPLTMITGYSEVMRDLPGENTPENVQVIIDEANRLTSLVNDVLDLSKLQSGSQSMQCSVYNLTQSVRNILTRYDKMTDYHIVFRADKDVFVFADELKISQVVYNLVNNAITHTGADKTVTLVQTMKNGKVKIAVSDTGEGIPADKLRDIWQRYYKVDKEHKRAQIGTGLGLSIVKTILEMHGGRYGVQSQVNVGSTFWFELDVTAPEIEESNTKE